MPRHHRLLIPLLTIATLFLLHFIFSPSAHHNHTLEEVIEPPQTLHQSSQPSKSHRHPSLRPADNVEIDSRGLAFYRLGDSVHPVEKLIERGKRLAKALEERIDAIKTLQDSVDDYERAFGMKPPKGFDYWYSFTQSFADPRPPPLASLFPLAHTPFLSFLALKPTTLRSRVEHMVANHWSLFSITFVPDGEGDIGTACTLDQGWDPSDWYDRERGRVIMKGEAAWGWRANNTLTLLLPILPLLPPELFTMNPPLELAFSTDDGPRGMIHHDIKQQGEALGRAGKVWPQVQLDRAEKAMGWTYGWHWTCPPDSPLKIQSADKVLNDLQSPQNPMEGSSSFSEERSFIADFDQNADFCYNPDLANYHHVLLVDSNKASVNLIPTVATCRTMYNSDILGVPLDGVWEEVDFVPWEQKSISKAFWRGTATGLFHSKDTPWRHAQRERLHFLSHNTSDVPVQILMNKPEGLQLQAWDRKILNEAWLDVGLAGGPVQCNQEDGSCEDMEKEIVFMGRVQKEYAAQYKFVIDVDGNGWSSRFRRLLAGNNVVLKSTLYTEWFHEILIPWYHYVPLKVDYTDLYDILGFFMGSPDGSVKGRDDLAEEIAANGLRFAEERWRTEDMQSYMFLLILEYWRLMAENRGEAVYTGQT